MASLFTRIVNGDIPCYKVAETDEFLAFLDINPLNAGHTLAIPKREVDYIFDLDADTYAGLMRFAKQVAHAVESVVTCERIGVAVIGLEVPHAHVHLVPINRIADLDFSKPRVDMTPEGFQTLAGRIAAAFEAQ